MMGRLDNSVQQIRHNQQISRITMGQWFGHLFGKFLGWSLVRVLHWFLTVVFLFVSIASVLAIPHNTASAPVAIFVLMMVWLVGSLVGGYFWRPLLWVAPFAGDWMRRVRRVERLRQLNAGRNFLLNMGVSPEKADRARVYMREADGQLILNLNSVIDGISPQQFAKKASEFAPAVGAVRSRAEMKDNGGVEVSFYMDDPLDEPRTLDHAAKLDPEKMAVECAVDSLGNAMSITFGDSSGMVVGGLPGSGKTAGTTTFLLPLALSEYVNLSIIDGKGGDDWTAYEGVSQRFIRGDEDLVVIRDFLKEHHDKMVERVATNREKLGESNFWNVSAEQRLKAGLKFELLVIDECQGLFETQGQTKENKDLIAEITRYCSILVKRGRSAGFCVIYMTQRPTADSLPTGIRDNSGLRVAFRVSTSVAETAVLGTVPEDSLNTPRAMAIPMERKGGAVLANDKGELEAVRFFYVPEKIQHDLLVSAEKAA